MSEVTVEPSSFTLVDFDAGEIAGIVGRLLAKGHARTSGASMIAGYLGKGSAFDGAVADFAMAYARQSIADHALLVTDFLTTPEPQAR